MQRGRASKIFDLLIILAAVLGFRAATARADGLVTLEGAVLVSDGSGAQVHGATVQVLCGKVMRTTKTDALGRFAFSGLPAGRCTLIAQAPGFERGTRPVMVQSGANARVELALARKQVADPKPRMVAAEPAAERVADAPSPAVRPPARPAYRHVSSGTAMQIAPAAQPLVVGGDPDHNTEAYARIDDNPFFRSQTAPLSTFSADVDTASYSNLRRFLTGGRLPPKDAVRIEEMLNYFKYDYPAPARGEPFSITTELGTSPWNPKHQLVRIGLATAPIADAQVPARNLVFLIDVSGSMNPPNRLPLLKQSMSLLIDTLRPEDRVSMVVYAGASGVALPPTSGRDKDKIRAALFALEAGGSTNGASGIKLAYQLAAQTKIKGGINRVILATDGDFNVGVTSEGELTRLIETERERGVFLTVLGFGMGNLKDSTMEKLANRGNGNYAYIDSIAEARKVLVKEAGATLVTVAKDVKLQVEFNPAKVAGYRLIGYENRLLRHQDFNDDKKDAGDMGAGHTVTALYELVPAGVEVPGAKVDALKYQTATSPNAAAAGAELMTIKVRYKAPDGNTSKLLSRAVTGQATELAKTSHDFRWAAAISAFGMLLRDSPYRGNLTWKEIRALAEGAKGKDSEGYRTQALELIRMASQLKP
jgi:Ca-activated chloride channel homolog